MKHLNILLPLLFICSFLSAQNNPPIAVNDTFYVDYNDSLYLINIPYNNIYANDSDPNSNAIFVDTSWYTGSANYIQYPIVGSQYRFSYKPSLNYWGIDSVQYILKDNGTPVMYDTAWIYLFVKRPEFEYLDLNNIRAKVDLWSLFSNTATAPLGFEVPKGSGLQTYYAANLWVAGTLQDSVYMNAETYGTSYTLGNSITGFSAPSGPIMDSMYYKEYDYEWDRLWKIDNWQISYHQNNWSNVGYQPIEVIENWPAHGDTSKGQAFYLAPFIDNNNDGIYNPYDGDYPRIKGQQAIYFIYNDIRAQANTSNPMKTEVHSMAYVYNCPSDSAINNTVFIDYTLYNRSVNTYDSCFTGLWSDMDLGSSSDDYVGCDVARSSYYFYNGDSVDPGGYQSHPPAQSVTFLKGAKQDNDGIDNPYTTIVQNAMDSSGIVYPALGNGFGDGTTDNEYWGMERFMPYSIGSGQFIGDGDPQITKDYYYYLSGVWRDSSKFVWGGNGHPAGGGTVPSKYLYPGTSDPLFYSTSGVTASPVTWFEPTVGNTPGDRRGIGSTGPFTFEPDSSIELTLAIVFGRDYQNTGNLTAITVMNERIDSIRSYYLNGFTTTACGITLKVAESEPDDNALVVYPNPFNGLLNIHYIPQNEMAEVRIFDVYGQLVKERLLTNSVTIVDLSRQAKGIYLVQVVDGQQVLTKKVVKQ
ncbi:MAG: T9SS type A sorting domain-containing protein [Flavobacteriales bacterium]|nr:T9SS type A sorting domain-containing protein [Flavobacteriales bacterium]